jgi:protocatechuate 3,4-dioxygenase beta subunit
MTLSGTASATTITDSSGSYTFTGLRSGTYTVTPSKSEYTFTPTSQQVPVSGANVTGVNFVATAITYSISGKVTGVIQAGVTMTLSGTVSASTTTDSLGSYTFTGLRSGTYTVTPSKSEYKFTPASQQVTVSGENVSGVDFMAAVATYAISGTVSGAVQAGVTMMLSGIVATSTTTDSSGNYIFSGLGNGTYTVTPNKSRYAFNPPNILVTINNGNQAEQNFTATAVTYSISGTVSGAVQAGVTMTLSVAGSATTTTDASGNYAFNELENGTYTVMPSKEGYAFTPESREVVVSGEDVDRVDFVSSVSSCTIWSDVITTYDAYVTGEAIWSEVMECYNEYASP